MVVNFDIPTHSKDYIHRVGRTARAGRAGRSITVVTQYDVELYQRIEHLIGEPRTDLPAEGRGGGGRVLLIGGLDCLEVQSDVHRRCGWLWLAVDRRSVGL